MEETRRQRMARLLREGGASVTDLSRLTRAPVKSVLADLEHVRRGIARDEAWIVEPASCGECGFEFRGRERLDSPSRCPRCRGERIEEARFRIEKRRT